MALLAVVAATVAAWWPARMTSRVSVMAALAGRPAVPRPVHRPLFVAVALVAAGAIAIAVADPLSAHVQPVLFVGGLVAVVVGTVFAAPGAIRAGGRLARRLPFAPRVALRDLARYQARAAAALGAITLGLAVSIGIVAVAAAAEPAPEDGDLSDRELLILTGDLDAALSPDLTASEIAELDRQAADVIAALGEDVASAPLDVAVSSRPMPDASPREPIWLGVATSPDTVEGRGQPFVATDALLALYGIDPQSVEPGVELLTSRRGRFILFDATTAPRQDPAPAERQHVDLPKYRSAPNALITEAAMAAHGWLPARAGWIVESPSPLTREQVQAARQAAAEVGLEVAGRETHDELAALRTGATLVGGLLAVAIVAIAVGLIRSEARRDLRTLTATGARGRTRRALTATTAAGLALPGVILGLTGAYLALVASYHADLGRLLPIPVSQLVPLAIGTPLAAAGIGWLLAGREPRSIRPPGARVRPHRQRGLLPPSFPPHALTRAQHLAEQVVEPAGLGRDQHRGAGPVAGRQGQPAHHGNPSPRSRACDPRRRPRAFVTHGPRRALTRPRPQPGAGGGRCAHGRPDGRRGWRAGGCRRAGGSRGGVGVGRPPAHRGPRAGPTRGRARPRRRPATRGRSSGPGPGRRRSRLPCGRARARCGRPGSGSTRSMSRR